MSSKYKLSPSSSGRFLTCTASLPLNVSSFQESKASLIGNLQHKVAHLRLEQLLEDKDNTDKIEKLMDYDIPFTSKKTPGLEVFWNKTCEDTVGNYINYIKRLIDHYKPKLIFLEHYVKMTFHGNKITGIVDFAMVLKNNDIFIVDLKTGRGHVDTEDNNQMLMYGYGFLQDVYNNTKKVPQNVVISIHQSIIGNVEAINYSLPQMTQWYKELAGPMNEINTDKLVFRPTKGGCKYCDYRDDCNERIAQGIY